MKVIILAGGSGTRLWPLSRSTYPKQFLRFSDEHSLLQKTVLRFLKQLGAKNLLVVTSKEYEHLVRSQIIDLDPELVHQIALEPAKKNTAPAIAWGFKVLKEKFGLEAGEPVLICPSDQLIAPEEAFLTSVSESTSFAEEGNIVTFGVRPSRPETGYGYIKVISERGISPIDAFVEKPDLEKATQYVCSGQYFWNTGIFLLTQEAFWKEAQEHEPLIGQYSQTSAQEFNAVFATLPEVSMDYAIMEKTKRAMMMPLQITWSDVGSWDSLYEVLDKDAENNVILGNVQTLDTKQSLIVGGKRLISTIGLDEMLVIDTEDAVFIAKRGHSQQVKVLVDALKAKGAKQVIEHKEVQRPWGSYTVLEEGLRYKIKRISVAPLQRLSLQMHYHRSEHWVVVQGTANVTIGDREMLVHENESVYVPKSAVHRLENPGKVPLEIIEVQVGEYLSEDDIVRLEDIYNRV